FDLSRDVLLLTDSREAIGQLARYISRRFDMDYVAICLPRAGAWDLFESGTLEIAIDRHQLDLVFAGVERVLEFDAQARTYSGHREIDSGDQRVRIVPLRLGTK